MREYFCAYHSMLGGMRKLSDAECGRLFRALLSYSAGTDVEQINLQGREEVLFDVFSQQIDRDIASYDERCEQNRENAKKRSQANGSDRKRSVANGSETSQDKDKDKDKGKDKDEKNPPKSPQGEIRRFSPMLEKAVADWLSYKKERRENYKTTGLNALLSQIENAAKAHGEAAVIKVIRDSMASNYAGIVFDRLNRRGAAPNGGNPFMDLLKEGYFDE